MFFSSSRRSPRRFRPAVDALPSRIAPTILAPVDMGTTAPPPPSPGETPLPPATILNPMPPTTCE